ncbi:hypothetical protein [Aphanothece sacrum]|uniref:Uncharacterized protein n=1 Tax=Aphanothece sacrum FPU1 TaxID=1920663 RepID=A0A401IIG9_APHSA|nr:hypothetical protein [Aphanothece sacrum]GBF81115.1 hypothetical protein AsFPU1_2527 [Aphanothece sacrum FPU1]GBF86229.1 hypothetical protein AsFPU3_3300 [Aphanothece sacrum FPU3]
MTKEDNLQELISELQSAGIKHNPKEIIKAIRLSDGKIIFLEQGNRKSGLQHILERHGVDFMNRGIAYHRIAEVIIKAIIEGEIIGKQGETRNIYQFVFDGTVQHISIDIGTNGYIVGANPTPRKLMSLLRQE